MLAGPLFEAEAHATAIRDRRLDEIACSTWVLAPKHPRTHVTQRGRDAYSSPRQSLPSNHLPSRRSGAD
jgi:hypothetical protein